MKTLRATRPTRCQEQLIDRLKLPGGNYLVVSETATAITLYNKITGKTIIIRYTGEEK